MTFREKISSDPGALIKAVVDNNPAAVAEKMAPLEIPRLTTSGMMNVLKGMWEKGKAQEAMGYLDVPWQISQNAEANEFFQTYASKGDSLIKAMANADSKTDETPPIILDSPVMKTISTMAILFVIVMVAYVIFQD